MNRHDTRLYHQEITAMKGFEPKSQARDQKSRDLSSSLSHVTSRDQKPLSSHVTYHVTTLAIRSTVR